MSGMYVDMIYYECWVCSVPFGISAAYRDRKTKTGEGFCCPNGCKLSFGEGSIKRLQRELDQAVAARDRALHARDIAEKRAEEYPCPHCNKRYKHKASLLKHTDKVHSTTKRLTTKAGPSAFNTKLVD